MENFNLRNMKKYENFFRFLVANFELIYLPWLKREKPKEIKKFSCLILYFGILRFFVLGRKIESKEKAKVPVKGSLQLCVYRTELFCNIDFSFCCSDVVYMESGKRRKKGKFVDTIFGERPVFVLRSKESRAFSIVHSVFAHP